ncbi:MAG: outer membrane protein [Methylocella sp.]
MKHTLTLAVSLLALSSAVAEAAPYVEVNLGGSIPMDTDFKNSISPDAQLSFNPTVAVTAAAGYAFENGLRAEFEYGYQAPDIDKLTGHVLGVPVTFTGNGASVTVNTILANGYYDFKTAYKITPLVGGGLGVAVVSAHTNAPNATQVTLSSSDTATVFAYQATAGASYPVTDHVSLTGSYRYLGTSEGTFNTTLYNGLTPFGTSPAKVAFSDNVIRVGLRYTF